MLIYFKFRITIPLVCLLAGIQSGCSISHVVTDAGYVRSQSRVCSQDNQDDGSCFSVPQAMAQMKVPKDNDELFENIRLLVYSDLLRKPEFYGSNEYLLKAFGAIDVQRKSSNYADILDTSQSITIRLGKMPRQWCEITKFREDRVQLYCLSSALLYQPSEKNEVGNDRYSTMSSDEIDEYLDAEYRKFRHDFPGEWQDVDIFDRQRHEKMMILGAFGTAIAQPIPNGFGKDILIGNYTYRIRVGRAINGLWNGIAIDVKNNDAKK